MGGGGTTMTTMISENREELVLGSSLGPRFELAFDLCRRDVDVSTLSLTIGDLYWLQRADFLLLR